MRQGLLEIFAYIGASCVIGIVAILLAAGFDKVRDKIKDLKYKYEYEHRFDYPPVAKCYCIDCENYSSDGRRCYHRSDYLPDNGFCYRAEPKERDD